VKLPPLDRLPRRPMWPLIHSTVLRLRSIQTQRVRPQPLSGVGADVVPIHRRRHDSAMPRPGTFSAIGFSRRRASPAALRRDLGGSDSGIQDSVPRRSSPRNSCPEKGIRLLPLP
jgi:hypothetical protein